MLWVFREEMKKSTGTFRFWGLAAALAGICLLMPVRNSSGELHNSIELLFLMERETVAAEPLYALFEVLRQFETGYFVMFVPLVVGIALLPILCGDWESGILRYELVRIGKKRLLSGKLLACMATAFLVVFAGFSLAGLLLWGKLPHPAAGIAMYGAPWVAGVVELLPGFGVNLFLLFWAALGCGAYGMAVSLWVYLLAALVENRYLLVSIPYIFFWFIERGFTRISYPENGSVTFAVWLYGKLGANSVMQMFSAWRTGTGLLAFYGVFAVLAFVLRLAAMERRMDCGA